ncbi:MAG: hypothetical protein DRJ44_01845 [Thermoprotei archaeon]|nr:MAG: hypothetical protein DRJ44_01845 [Thermoprotei archaeon]
MNYIFEGFKFKKKNTLIHDLDPRAKFIYLIMSFISALLFTEPIPLVIIFLTSLPLVIIAKTLKEWSRSMKSLSLFVTFIFILNLLSMTENRLNYAFSMVFRFLALTSAFSVFFLTTTPDDFMSALEEMGLPKEYTLMFTMSMRFVPTLARDLQIIVDAQKSRGLELEKGSLIKKVRNYVPILIPLIIYEIRRSIMIAEALEARAFGALRKTTSYTELKMGIRDYIFIFIVVFFFGMLIFLKIFGYLPEWMMIKLPEII